VSTREGNRQELTGPGDAGRGLGHYYVAHIFVFLGSNIIFRLYKLTLSDEHQVSLKISQSFRFSVKIFSRSALAFFLNRGPNLHSTILWRSTWYIAKGMTGED
jgi:hypothetical protein